MDVKNTLESTIEKLNFYRLFQLSHIANFILYEKLKQTSNISKIKLYESYLNLADSYIDIELPGIAYQIANEVLKKLENSPDSREKELLTAYAHYVIGIFFYNINNYFTAAKNQSIAKKIYESVGETGKLYSNILFEFAHATYKMGWMPNKFVCKISKIYAHIFNIFKIPFLKRHLRNELKKNPNYLQNEKKELGDIAQNISDTEQLIEMIAKKIVEDEKKTLNFSEIYDFILTAKEGRKILKKIIKLDKEKTTVTSAYELIAFSYGKKKKKVALEYIKNSINEIKKLTNYKKHPKLSFSYIILGFWGEDKAKLDETKDIALAEYENNTSLTTLISCCEEYADVLQNNNRFEEAISLYEETIAMYNKIEEVNYIKLKELMKQLSYCYEKIGETSKSLFYNKEAEKYSTISIGVNLVSQINMFDDLDNFLKSESIRAFYGYRKCTLKDLNNKDTFIEYENEFIDYANQLMDSLETNNEEFRDFDTCHSILKSIITGERSFLKDFSSYNEKESKYSTALKYRDGFENQPPNMQKSFELLQEAEKLGSIKAKTELGLLYSINPIKADIYEGIFDYREVKALNLPTKERLSIAKQYWKEASLEKDSRAMYLMGKYYYDINNYSNAELWLDLASEHGVIVADYYLGQLYSDSENYRFFDFDEAISRYSKVANCKKTEYESLSNLASQTIENLKTRFMFYNYRKSDNL